MKGAYELPSASPIVRILQITDPHLFATPDGQLLGVPTVKSFQAVLDAIQKEAFDYEIILATGDLVQDHNREAYHRFGQMVKQLKKPLFWIEGNHDLQPQMSNALGIYAQIQPHRHILLSNNWQVVLLDSHVFGKPGGKLSKSQLAWLAETLKNNAERYTLVVLHHNILPTNSAWLDQHSLSNPEQLADVLSDFPNVKAILHGHIHQEVDKKWMDYRVLATPSTCIQFKPNCDKFTLDIKSPGWRELNLMPNGVIKTVVKRLEDACFLPNFSATGY
ncbi:3',5'-cyclic-AMP phosphodiesterase [Otariodibacter oris]|uniref:3',5'-cyclic adenosine monophosphate phosphodiesterase CpdA n=1 Tax=Otariodibacter oris TaxID=1032623 RepID=A0A420XF58_9PAST|nr:3',5'-cyclic-AMP phosphodiesterase [Otariodibacter oris]QGM81518.1 3',5'-cyclic-AMP phosphodiesterase [Otariodibacter oris]RKR71124.1 Icc protein [Otariodibacter oris]